MADAVQTWLERNHFLLRRLHSLSGIVPIGAFLINHLLTNATAWLGPEHFNDHVHLLHSLPFLLAIEIVFIFAPLAFHAGYGIVIAMQGKSNVGHYPYLDNWRYVLQRVTAWIAFFFVIAHLLHYRFAHWFGGAEYKDAADFFLLTQNGFVGSFLPVWAWLALYFIGLTASAFHFCNGISTFCITWGITVGDEARKRISLAAGGLFVVLMLWGVLSLRALAQSAAAADTSDYSGAAVADTRTR